MFLLFVSDYFIWGFLESNPSSVDGDSAVIARRC